MIDPVRRRDGGAPAQRAKPGAGARHGLARATSGSASTTGSPSSRRRSASRRSSARTSCSPRARGWPALYAERSGRSGRRPRARATPTAWCSPCRDRGEARRSWFVYVLRLPAGTDRDAVMAALGEQGIEAKAYLPCIHLMPHYRERFGFREGQFPVAEDASARSARAAVLRRDGGGRGRARGRGTGERPRPRLTPTARSAPSLGHPADGRAGCPPRGRELDPELGSRPRVSARGLPEQEGELARAEQRGAA